MDGSFGDKTKHGAYTKKLKVVFADPPFGRESKGEAVTESPNLGILYIIGYAKPRLPDVEFTYLEPFLSMEEHLEKVKEIKPDVYAISFTTPRRDLSFETITKVKAWVSICLWLQAAPTQPLTPKTSSKTPQSKSASWAKAKKPLLN